MNLGLREAADLADKFTSILREQGGLDLLQAYDRVHRAEWKRLLGLAVPEEQLQGRSPWVREHFSTILGCLPASGDDLNQLMKNL
jgi:2-polyprenyl-6-methoxyphenol hydroxylase-like FAD-dependent oxidoreductase